jgi:uncharacterized protein (UPF0332 family)
MRYKDSIESLLAEGIIQQCPLDLKAVNNLLARAGVDLETAARNLSADEECAYTYAYNAMLRAGLALMFAKGYRPDIKNKHRNIVRFAGCVVKGKLKGVIIDYDRMRRSRNRFIYEPDIPCSRKEAKAAINTARAFVNQVSGLVKEGKK